MKKKLVALVSVMFLSLTGCRANVGVVEEATPESNVLKRFERHVVGDDYYILEDKETGACYLEYKYAVGGYSGAYGITVMLNPDGTPVVWEEFNK